MFENSKGKSLPQLLDEFQQLRERNLKELSAMNLTPQLLERRGKHPALGTVTLAELLSSWVVHDLGHVSQIVRVMAKQYKDAVGPWTAYLSIVTR